MFRIIDSNIFEAIGVREIGLTSFSIVFGGFTFGAGITFADFHVSGIIPSRNELLLSGDVRKVQETSQIMWLMYCKSVICKSGQFEFDSVNNWKPV